MPRGRKDCPICGKRSLKRLANHLADVHELSIEERQPYLIRAKTTLLDLETILTELYKLNGNTKNKQSGINRIVLSVFISFQHVQHSVNTSISPDLR